MKYLKKLILVLVIFSIIFFVLRWYGNNFGYNLDLLILDLPGIVYLYSTVSTIFAVFTAFVIVSAASNWTALINASKNEVFEIGEILLWSRGLSQSLSKKISKNAETYLDAVINDEWKILEKGGDSKKAEDALLPFHNFITEAFKENSDLGIVMLTSFNNILKYRFDRIERSWQPLPRVIKYTIFFIVTVLIILSFLIGVRNASLQYIFMFCVVALSSIIIMVIEDLDNPLNAGEWHLKPDNHQNLLNSIRAQGKK